MSESANYIKGLEGEERVSQYFVEKGYKILERRFRSGPGEVDIIAKKRDTLAFVEVKTWDALGTESLERSINDRKRGRIREAATRFLVCHPEFGTCRVRFDVVFLSRRMGKLDHWENAF